MKPAGIYARVSTSDQVSEFVKYHIEPVDL